MVQRPLEGFQVTPMDFLAPNELRNAHRTPRMCLEPSIEPQSYLGIAIKYRAKMSSFDQKCTFKKKHAYMTFEDLREKT